MEYSFSKDKIWFLGRSYPEYMSMFKLDPEFLKDKTILDCAAGASSFTPVMGNHGCDIIALDPLYGINYNEAKERSINDFQTLIKAHSGLECKVDWNFFQNSKNMIEERMKACKEFIDDYKVFKGLRYIKGKLPQLPFANNQFSLTLCSHLLFLYDDRLDYQFHLESIQEMLRVTAGEVRIYPLVNLQGNGEKSNFVNRIKEDLTNEANVEIVEVNYRFRKGGNEMMKIKGEKGEN
ncbi:class I SAM-dependent methyltransferase [Methanobacterium ferruginis]|uniref:class I SAM-dependent methyltransferase n=1 Tax=Methanobacterium ferruginis TaxID=710191 RepID=UPI002572D1D8|nr:class I SAM-dependent methyltransferase [Methanobacterium ferruginis]